MVIQFALASLVLYLVPAFRPSSAYSSDQGRSRHETEPKSTGMSKMFYLTRIGPCGTATGLDIGLGNMSLRFISLTFYSKFAQMTFDYIFPLTCTNNVLAMCKSSSLGFVLIFAFLFRLETPTWRLVAIIGTMIIGVILMVFGEVNFRLDGFALVISAAFFSGFRWGLTQLLLLRNPATSNPFSSIYYLTPVMFVTLFLLAAIVEGFRDFGEGYKALAEQWGWFMTPLFLLFPGTIAFGMTAAEFALLKRTSVVTLSIAGIFKEVITISAASIFFQDKLTIINFVGLIVTLCAIVAYNFLKISKLRAETEGDLQAKDGEYSAITPESRSGHDSEEEHGVEEQEESAGLLLHTDTSLTDPDAQLTMSPIPETPHNDKPEHLTK